MKKYIKALNEYEDSDLLDLMGDLGDIGFENYQGWVFMWDSPTEKPLVEVMIAPGPREAFQLYKDNGWFGADIQYAEGSGVKFSDLEEVFKYLLKNKIVSSYQLAWGLNANEKKSAFFQIDNINPFATVRFMNQKFDNAEKRFETLFPSGIIKKA
jgi:hypothetical protein